MSVLVDLLHSDAILTGSRAFKVEQDGSDWDFILTEKLTQQIVPSNVSVKSCNPFDEDHDKTEGYDSTIYGETLIDIVIQVEILVAEQLLVLR